MSHAKKKQTPAVPKGPKGAPIGVTLTTQMGLKTSPLELQVRMVKETPWLNFKTSKKPPELDGTVPKFGGLVVDLQ